jgi:hypothetical protein
MPSMETQFEWQGLTLDVDFEFNQGAPAQLYGPPENCYPAEGDEITRMDITVGDEDFDVGGIEYWEDCPHIVWNAKKKVFVWAHNQSHEALDQKNYRILGNRVQKHKNLESEIDDHCLDLAAQWED